MVAKLIQLIIWGIGSGLIAGLLIPVIAYLYLELTASNSGPNQWNILALVVSVFYLVPIGVIIGIATSLTFIKFDLTRKRLFAVLTLITTIFVGVFCWIYLFWLNFN